MLERKTNRVRTYHEQSRDALLSVSDIGANETKSCPVPVVNPSFTGISTSGHVVGGISWVEIAPTRGAVSSVTTVLKRDLGYYCTPLSVHPGHRQVQPWF